MVTERRASLLTMTKLSCQPQWRTGPRRRSWCSRRRKAPATWIWAASSLTSPREPQGLEAAVMALG